jgi:sugar/nucleoside kinase (ribokinase family)
MHSYDVVTIGNYTKDTIISSAGTRYVDGGGYSYAAHAAHLKGLRIAALTRLADEDRGSTDALRAKGIDVHIFESPQSTRMCLEYPTDNVDERTLTVASVAEPFTPELVAAFDARAFVVNGSARGEASLDVMQTLRAKGGLLCADLQGFIRVVSDSGRLEYRPWPEQAEILGLLDILKTDAVEAEFLTGETDIHKAAAELAAFGPRDIVLTHRDGLLVLSGGRYFEAGFYPA